MADNKGNILVKYWPIIGFIIGIIFGAGLKLGTTSSVDTADAEDLTSLKQQVNINTVAIATLKQGLNDQSGQLTYIVTKVDLISQKVGV